MKTNRFKYVAPNGQAYGTKVIYGNWNNSEESWCVAVAFQEVTGLYACAPGLDKVSPCGFGRHPRAVTCTQLLAHLPDCPLHG